MQYIYFGSDQFSLNILKGLFEIKAPLAIVTQPDKARGRKQKVKPGPLAEFALEKGIELIQPENLKAGEHADAVLSVPSDLHVVVSFGQILPQSFLDRAPTIINGHASLLPDLRGASPIQSSIMRGLAKTGMSIMHIVKALDAGPVIKMEEINIEEDDNGGTLMSKLENSGIKLLGDCIVLDSIPEGAEQDHATATYCHKITKADMRLKSESDSTQDLSLMIRALSPAFGGYVLVDTNKGEMRLKLFDATFDSYRGEPNSLFQEGKSLYLNGQGEEASLKILNLQPPGKSCMDAVSFLNGWNMDFKGEIIVP
jgi:methionyl-tRNA formyltransferase